MTTEQIHKLLDYLKSEKNDCTKSDYDQGYKQAMVNIIEMIQEESPTEYDSWPEKPFDDELVPSDWWSGGIADNH
jgi:hypothetical protein